MMSWDSKNNHSGALSVHCFEQVIAIGSWQTPDEVVLLGGQHNVSPSIDSQWKITGWWKRRGWWPLPTKYRKISPTKSATCDQLIWFPREQIGCQKQKNSQVSNHWSYNRKLAVFGWDSQLQLAMADRSPSCVQQCLLEMTFTAATRLKGIHTLSTKSAQVPLLLT